MEADDWEGQRGILTVIATQSSCQAYMRCSSSPTSAMTYFVSSCIVLAVGYRDTAASACVAHRTIVCDRNVAFNGLVDMTLLWRYLLMRVSHSPVAPDASQSHRSQHSHIRETSPSFGNIYVFNTRTIHFYKDLRRHRARYANTTNADACGNNAMPTNTYGSWRLTSSYSDRCLWLDQKGTRCRDACVFHRGTSEEEVRKYRW